MPAKPEAEIYSSIGYFKHGKTVLFQDVCRHTAQCSDGLFNISQGMRGMVMVVFYDYDEIIPLTDCRFRKIPQARNYMEEMADEPWYTVEEKDVFPEEFSRFLGLSGEHRKLFLSRHADLLAMDFWIKAQDEIHSGHIRHIHPYHPWNRLEG